MTILSLSTVSKEHNTSNIVVLQKTTYIDKRWGNSIDQAVFCRAVRGQRCFPEERGGGK
ncbi:hypothetical protein D3C81_2024630 [compost metagenome]